MLALPEKQINLARVKLTIDRMIDTHIDVDESLQEIDTLAAAIRQRLTPLVTKHNQMVILQDAIYNAAALNDYRPFRYNLSDPIGEDIRTKLLPSYLKTRLGNCVSMPWLLIAIGERVGLEITAAQAPSHVLVKYRSDDGLFHNYEATSGSAMTDEMYRENFLMTNTAISRGHYLRPLDKKEMILLAADTLMFFYGEHGMEEQRIALAELALKHYPNRLSPLLHISYAYYRLMEREYLSKYKSEREIPAEKQERFVMMVVPGLVTLVLAVHVQNADAVYVNGQPLMLVDPYGLAPGDRFKSADDAALDAGNWARKFKMQRIEYGGWIYKEEKCHVYDASGVGGGSSAKLKAKPANAVAAWHTHSSRAPFFEDNDEEFSGEDESGNGDMAWVNHWKKPLNLRTPREITKVLPVSRRVRTIPNRSVQSCDCTN